MSLYPHGNYQNYYPRRRKANLLPSDRDERIALLVERRPDFFEGKKVLDIGCNVGQVSVEVAQRHGASHVTGIDIDPTLISQCQYTIRAAYSTEAPAGPSRSDSSIEPDVKESGKRKNKKAVEVEPERSARKRRKLDDANEREDRLDYFPSCFPTLFGLLPLPPIGRATTTSPSAIDTSSAVAEESTQPEMGAAPTSTSEAGMARSFPRNMDFVARDWMDDEGSSEVESYDVIMALSITKWIHLNTLDTGLIAFFHKTFSSLKPGGALVLERQGWAGYKGAKRGVEKLKENYPLLKLRPETDYERILLEDVGFERREAVREPDVSGGKEGFDRALEVYYKSST